MDEQQKAPEATETQATQATAPAEETVTLTSKQLADRMERAVRSFLKKEIGIESADALKAEWSKKSNLEQAEEARRLSAMSEQQKLQEQLASERAAREAAESAAEQARVDLHLSRLYAKHGVLNADYATWRIMDRLNALPDGEELDEEQFLTGLLAHESERVALGAAARAPSAPEPQRVAVPANTTTPPGQAPRAPSANAAPPPKSAYDLSGQEWSRRKSELGIP